MYSNNVLKQMYKMYFNNENLRYIAITIKKRYGVKQSIENIEKDLPKIFGERVRKKDFSNMEISYLLYMYKNCSDIDKTVDYINSKNRVKKNITKNGLFLLAAKHKVKKVAKKIAWNSTTTKADRAKIIEMYEKGMSSEKIMKHYNCKTSKTILDILKDNNVKIRNGSDAYINTDFDFKEINTKFKAYYLGILLTDGYINSKRNNVSVQMTDKDVIEFINDNTSGNMTEIKARSTKHKIMYRTSIHNSDYKNQLARLGVVEKKSLSLQSPILTDNEKTFLPYIIRGIIDGDGWIKKDGKEFFICSASECFIDWCKESLESLGMIKLNKRFIQNDTNGIYILRTGRQENIKILKDIIYDTPFGMERKYKKLHNDVQRL